MFYLSKDINKIKKTSNNNEIRINDPYQIYNFLSTNPYKSLHVLKKRNEEENSNYNIFYALVIDCSFLTHNDVYKQNINRKRLNICPKT